MAGIAIKALAVAALVCLVFDRSHAVDVQQGLGQQGLDLLKGKMSEYFQSLATSNAAQTPGLNQQGIQQGIGQGIGQAIGQQGVDAAKQKLNEFMNSFKGGQPQPQQPQLQQPQQPQAGQNALMDGVGQGFKQTVGQQGMNAAKEKYNEFLSSIKQTASETFNRAVKEPETTKKVEQQVSNFFSGALSKLKTAFGSSAKTAAGPGTSDDSTKQQAIRAFDEYAEKQSNGKPIHLR